MQIKWLIKNKNLTDDIGYSLYWSNEQGWVDLQDATWFDINTINSLSLPDGGEWVEVKCGNKSNS